ncbi:MAG: PQQ-dependent sugar dehydrogenase [Solirubrobacterales bacterium]
MSPLPSPRLLPLLAAFLVAALIAQGCGGSEPVTTAGASGSGKDLRLAEVGDFSEPVDVVQPPAGGDLYVVERGGAIRVVRDGRTLPRPFLDLAGRIEDGYVEQGLLSMAFAPDYASSGRLYVDYTDRAGDSRIVEFRRSAADPLRADPASARVVLRQDQPFENHNGGQLSFGPDGFLYVGFGDGGDAGDPDRNGEDLGTFLGKILRIDPAPSGGRPYSVPPGNPFVGRPGARPEIYSYGLRNPWRFSFDAATGALAIGDVGQDRFEEVDYVPRGAGRGANFGWSALEGRAPFNRDQARLARNAIAPALTYGRSRGCSVTGGYTVRDPALTALRGRYLYGDYCSGELRSFVPPGEAGGRARDDRPVGLEVPQLSSFGRDSAGRIYAVSLSGAVYRIAAGR